MPTLDTFSAALHRAGVDGPDLHPLNDRSPHIAAFTVDGRAALEIFERLSTQAGDTGVWPLLSGDPADEPTLAEQIEINEVSPEEILELTEGFSVAEWREFTIKESGVDPPAVGRWPFFAPSPRKSFVTHLDRRGRPLARANILLAAADENWQIPAVLRFGGWNACPPPEDHAALLRIWSEQFGARIVGVTYDTLELSIEQPPTDEAVCNELAQIHYLYCSDIGSDLGKHAAALRNSRTWLFWWD